VEIIQEVLSVVYGGSHIIIIIIISMWGRTLLLTSTSQEVSVLFISTKRAEQCMVPTGIYACVIPDAANVLRNLFISISESQFNECMGFTVHTCIIILPLILLRSA
jgi:predicted transglutaminase-like protease